MQDFIRKIGQNIEKLSKRLKEKKILLNKFLIHKILKLIRIIHNNNDIKIKLIYLTNQNYIKNFNDSNNNIVYLFMINCKNFKD